MSDNLEWQTEESDEWEDYEEDYDTEDSTPIIEELQKERDMLKEELRKKEIQKILNKIYTRFGIEHTVEELSEINMTPEELYSTYEMLHRNMWDIGYLLQHKKEILSQLDKFIEKNGELKQFETIKGFGDNLCEWNTATHDLSVLNDNLATFFHALLPKLIKAIEVAKKGHKALLEMIRNNVQEYLKLIGEKEGYDRYYDRRGEYYTPKYYKHKLKEEDKMVSYEALSDELNEYEKYIILKEQFKKEMAKSGKQLPFESPDKQPYENISLAEQLARKHSFDEVLRGGSLDKENREQLQKSNEKDAKFQLLGDVYSLHTEQIREIGSKLAQETEEASIHSEEPLSELGKLAKKFIEKEGKREY